jgi:hypothetical protein
MLWSKVKTHGPHPSPRAGCSGALCGTKWYIVGGATKKKCMSQALHYGYSIWMIKFIIIFYVSYMKRTVIFLVMAYSFATSIKFSGHAETWVFDILQSKWCVCVVPPSSSITTKKVSSFSFYP